MRTPRPGRRSVGQSSILNDISLPPSRFPKINAKLALALELERERELALVLDRIHSTASLFMKQKILAIKQRGMKARRRIINRLL